MTKIVVNVVPSVPGKRGRSEKEIPIKQKDAWELKREEQKRQQTPPHTRVSTAFTRAWATGDHL